MWKGCKRLHNDAQHAESLEDASLIRGLLAVQGAYFVATGLWPLFHMRSFEAVTGPKTDRWLVKTVGLCVSCIGGAILCAAARNRVTPEIRNLGVSSALSLAGIDIWYSLKGRISKIYLSDAIAELALVGGLASAALRPPDGEVFDSNRLGAVRAVLSDNAVEGQRSTADIERGVGLPR
jgi:hypothetical protein